MSGRLGKSERLGKSGGLGKPGRVGKPGRLGNPGRLKKSGRLGKSGRFGKPGKLGKTGLLWQQFHGQVQDRRGDPGGAGRDVSAEDEGCGGLEVECFGGPLHKAGEAGRGVLLHDDEEVGEAALGGLGDTGTCHTS